MKTCPYCKSQMDDDSLFCENCGKKYPQGLVCSNCGAELKENDKFCQSCGTKVEEIIPISNESVNVVGTQKRCPNCGTVIVDDSLFCENCGTKITKGEVASSEQKAVPNEETKPIEEKLKEPIKPTIQERAPYQQPVKKASSSMKMVLPVILGILIFALIGGGVWYYLSNKTSPVYTEKISVEEYGSLYTNIDFPSGTSKADINIKKWIKDFVTLAPCSGERIIYNGDVNDSGMLMDAVIEHCKNDVGIIHEIKIEKIFENEKYVTFKGYNMYSGGNSGYYHNTIASFVKSDGTQLKITDIIDTNSSEVINMIGYVPTADHFAVGFTDEKLLVVRTDECHGFKTEETVELPLFEAQKIAKLKFDWVKNSTASAGNSDEGKGKMLIEQLYVLIDKESEEIDTFIRDNSTQNAISQLERVWDYDCDDPNGCLGTWLFYHEEGNDSGDFVERKITSQGNETYLVTTKYEYDSYSVVIKLTKVGERYRIDDIERQY